MEETPKQKILIKTSFKLKNEYESLWNGIFGGEMVRIIHAQMHDAISFVGEKNNNKTMLIINVSANSLTVQFHTSFQTKTNHYQPQNQLHTVQYTLS